MGRKSLWTSLSLLIENLPRLEQKTFFCTMLRTLSRTYLKSNPTMTYDDISRGREDEAISGVAALVSGVVTNNTYLEECLMSWLTASNFDATALEIRPQRAVIAVLALSEGKNTSLVFKRSAEGYGGHLCLFSTRILPFHVPVLKVC